MPSVNQVNLIGTVTRDPELRYTGSQVAVCEVGLALSDKYKNQSGEWVEDTTFVDVTLWKRNAEIACEYLRKGSQVYITGRLKLDSWEQEGQKRTKLKIVGDKLMLLGGGNRQNSRQAADVSQTKPDEETPW